MGISGAFHIVSRAGMPRVSRVDRRAFLGRSHQGQSRSLQIIGRVQHRAVAVEEVEGLGQLASIGGQMMGASAPLPPGR